MFKAVGHAPVSQRQMQMVVGSLTLAQSSITSTKESCSLFGDKAYANALTAQLDILDLKIRNIKEATEAVAPLQLTPEQTGQIAEGLRRHIEDIAKEVVGLYELIIQGSSNTNREEGARALVQVSSLEENLIDVEMPLYKALFAFYHPLEKSSEKLLPVYYASFLGPENIPHDLLPEAEHVYCSFTKHLQFLNQRFLLHVGTQPGTFSIHPIVQKGAMKTLSLQTKESMLEHLYTQLDGVWEFDPKATTTWVSTEIFLPHVTALVKATPDESPLREKKAHYLNQLALYHAAVEMELRDRVRCRMDSIRVLIKEHGPDHAMVTKSLELLENDKATIKNFKLALEFHKEALAIYLKIHGPDHPTVALTHNSLGTLFEIIGSWAESEQHYRSALNGYTEQSKIAECYTNLGNISSKQERHITARDHYQAALDILNAYSNQGDTQEIAISKLADLHNKLEILCDRLGATEQAREHRRLKRTYQKMTMGED